MRVLLLLTLVGASLACQNRLETLVQEATGGAPDLSTDVHDECNSQVGTFNTAHAPEYKRVINKALRLAFEYMSVSSHFGRDTVHRLGFQQLFRSLSDARFEQAKNMIKYVTKRGGRMTGALNVQMSSGLNFNMEPLPALGRALTDTKDMYEEQARLHNSALCLGAAGGNCNLDPDLGHKSQDAVEEEVERANDLASKANLLASMFTTQEKNLAEHFFDHHLQKH